MVLILILIIAVGGLVWANHSLAQTGNLLSQPFGGRIISITPCFNGLKIKVGPPVSGDFVYMPGKSTLYAFYSLKPGSWVLGVASGKMVCPTGLADGIIDIVGTSAF